MDLLTILILISSSISIAQGLRWQGPAGYYRRLLDLPSICPHISLASPWSAPSNLSIDPDLRQKEEEKKLVLLRIGNISLIVTGQLCLSMLISLCISHYMVVKMVNSARVGAACCQGAGQHDQVGGAVWQGSGGQDGQAVQQEVRHGPLWPHCRFLLPGACSLAWREPQIWTWWA